MINQNRIAYLVKRMIDRTANEAEWLEINNLLNEDNDEVTDEIEFVLRQYGVKDRIALSTSDIEEMANAVLKADHVSKPKQVVKIVVIQFWKRIAVAASLLLLLGTAAYFLLFNKDKQNNIAKIKDPVHQDVPAPKSSKAMITLADGTTVALDTVASGTLANQGDIKVLKNANGEIVYSGSSDVLTYNTLTNPRGSKVIDITLIDGSRVWLNAGSSVTYPVAFVGKERSVSVNGEAYFEVAKNAAKPFKVSKGETEVTVLGTHFNVNAYDDETEIKVTLLEGSVQVKKGASSKIIKPGQQAVVANSAIQQINADVEEVMAWKNGSFQFKNAGIESIMRDLMRWYDIEVVYEGKKPDGHYGGMISRETNISEVLKVLEMSGVKTRIEGKKLIVM